MLHPQPEGLHYPKGAAHSNNVRILEQKTLKTLIDNAHLGVIGLRDDWKERGHIAPFFLLWSDMELEAIDGGAIDSGVVLDLPEDRSKWKSLMIDAVRKTQPYALLLGEQMEKEVVVILETEMGSHCWKLPIKDFGDKYLLGKVVQSANKENIGILWRPEETKGQA